MISVNAKESHNPGGAVEAGNLLFRFGYELVGKGEKPMTTHSSILAWEIPWTEKPGRLQSVGSHRVGHD